MPAPIALWIFFTEVQYKGTLPDAWKKIHAIKFCRHISSEWVGIYLEVRLFRIASSFSFRPHRLLFLSFLRGGAARWASINLVLMKNTELKFWASAYTTQAAAVPATFPQQFCSKDEIHLVFRTQSPLVLSAEAARRGPVSSNYDNDFYDVGHLPTKNWTETTRVSSHSPSNSPQITSFSLLIITRI